MILDNSHLAIFGRLFTVLIFTAALFNKAVGQTKFKSEKNKVDIEIYGGQNGNLFTNSSNLITVISADTTATYSVKSSQGIVWQLDKFMFFVDSLKRGKTTISIFKMDKGTEIKVLQKDYVVFIPKPVLKYNSLPISPDISIGGVTKGKFKLDSLKNISALSINDNYKILAATFFIGQTDLIIYSIKSKYFDGHLKKIWRRIMPGCTIAVDNIEFMDRNGNRYFYPSQLSIVVTE